MRCRGEISRRRARRIGRATVAHPRGVQRVRVHRARDTGSARCAHDIIARANERDDEHRCPTSASHQSEDGERMSSSIETLVNREYQYGFVTDIEADTLERGLNENVIRLISAKKEEPEWLLEWRLKPSRRWSTMQEPHHWANITYEPIDYQ